MTPPDNLNQTVNCHLSQTTKQPRKAVEITWPPGRTKTRTHFYSRSCQRVWGQQQRGQKTVWESPWKMEVPWLCATCCYSPCPCPPSRSKEGSLGSWVSLSLFPVDQCSV